MLPVYQASGVTPGLFTCRPANRRIKTVAMGNWLSGSAPAKRETMLLSSQAAAAYAGPLFHDSFCKGNFMTMGFADSRISFPSLQGRRSLGRCGGRSRHTFPTWRRARPIYGILPLTPLPAGEKAAAHSSQDARADLPA